MEMNMNIAGVRRTAAGPDLNLIVERLRSANAQLQLQLNAAKRKAESAKEAETELSHVRNELEVARKTIADLTAKLKNLTAKSEKKAKQVKAEASDKAE